MSSGLVPPWLGTPCAVQWCVRGRLPKSEFPVRSYFTTPFHFQGEIARWDMQRNIPMPVLTAMF